MRRNFVPIFLCLLSITGCHTLALRELPPRPLVPVSPAPVLARHAQKLTIEWRGEQHVLLGVVEQGDLYTSMAVLTPQGVVLFDALQTVDDLVIDRNPVVPERISPERVLADVQLINWPLESLQSAYRAPWRLEETRNGRRVSWNDRVIVDVRYHPELRHWQRAEMSAPELGYRMEIVQLAAEDY